MDYRLGTALLLSGLLHTMMLLGIGPVNFPVSLAKARLSELEITLVPEKLLEIPQKSDPFVPVDVTDESKPAEKLPPSKSDSSLLADPLQVQAKTEQAPSAPKMSHLAKRQVSAPQPLTQRQASRRIKVNHPTSSLALPQTLDAAAAKPLPSAKELIAAIEGQFANGSWRYTTQPRKRHIDSNTQQYAATAYLDAWRRKIERVGKMNYPEEAKRQGISGSLVLVVDLYPDGTVANIIVRRSSGYQALDKAAIRIVQLAAPFAKVPKDVLQGYNMLSITRTWRFRSGDDFSFN